MASTYLSRTQTSGNSKTFTYSGWLKRGNPTAGERPFFTASSDSNNRSSFMFESGDTLRLYNIDGGSVNVNLITTQLFRDYSAWYHIVLAVDTTQATASDRVKFYVNGEQVTSFSSSTYPNQNVNMKMNSAISHLLGHAPFSGSYYDGSMSHVHFIDGTAYDASAFGETDATTGIWKPKTAPSVTYGTNGFFLKFENSGSMGTDSSGNGNNFTVNGTMTQTIDTPSNVFATLNPLNKADLTYAYGNNQITNSTASHNGTHATLAVNSGKWYWETKYIDGATTKAMAGISIVTETIGNNLVGGTANSYGYYRANGQKYNNGTGSAYGTTPSNGSIIGVAFDADNGTLWFSLNGVWQNSATISEIANGITTNSAFSGISMSDYYAPACSAENSSVQTNFGNGYFGTTPVASAQNPDDGIGIFEYTVPTGYKAICTKSINAQEYD